ncbi:hypothetical protein SLEP1_g56811 [Rubroshorea leprosula]|uniref:RWP-RK domain-containing protein n=1 Tax=Rubroshorea leprosula TaxID=152421 RepID=A0AAV5MJL5_9ROSI|nr:hypothetical protein SLEP1_g56811 [Rubroshorea leprosula]
MFSVSWTIGIPPFEGLSIQEPFPDPTSIPQQGTGIGSSNYPFEYGGIRDMKNDPNTGNSQAGPSDIHVESSHGNQTNYFHAGSSNYEDSILLSEWPPTPIPFGCSCSQVLREIIHTNGNEFTTLEIHGRLGMISHAVLEVQLIMETLSPAITIKCLIFYEDLCVGFFWAENQYCEEFNPPPSSNSEELQGNNKAGNDNEQLRVPKTNLSEQRQRTGKITLKEIGNYFHLPIEEAAKKMRLCPTVVKKICRRDGLARWPHRKIKSMERQISYWAGLLSSNDPQESARAQNEILRLQHEIENICQGAVGSR